MIFRSHQWTQDLKNELQFHIDERAETLEHTGISREEALRRARLEFGALGSYTERCREAHGTRWIDELFRNLVYAVRSMRKRPGFTAVAVLSLMLGIGANLAVFSVLERLLLTKLPVRDPGGLYQVVLGSSTGPRYNMPYPKFELIRDHIPIFNPLFGWGDLSYRSSTAMTVNERQQPAHVAVVSGAYFDTLGLRPAAGRLLTAQDEPTGEIAVISYNLWQTAFSGDRSAISRSLKVGDASFQIVGVAPPGFTGATPADPADVFVPLHATERLRSNALKSEGLYWFHIMVRLKPDLPLATAQVMLRDQWPRLDAPFRIRRGNTGQPETMWLEDGSRGYSFVRQTFSKAILVLMGLVAAVFLIVCANLATLLFVRGAGRTREMSIRLALGAGRAQLIRQWMTECLLLSVMGGLAGIVSAHWITDLLLYFVAEQDRPWLRFQSDALVAVISIVLTLAAGILFGLLPGIRATRATPDAMLRLYSGSVTNRRGMLAQAVLGGQLAASLVLVIGAALFARTLWNLNHTSGGFDRTTTVYAVSDFAQLPRDRTGAILQEAVDRLSRSPNVLHVALGAPPILWGASSWAPIQVPGYVPPPIDDNIAYKHGVAPGYFQTVGIPIVAGRDFEERDRAPDANPVLIINQSLARHYFEGRNPLGQRMKQTFPATAPFTEIVGVVKDAKEVSLREVQKDVMYSPLGTNDFGAILARVKPGVASSAVETEIRSTMNALAKNIPVQTGRVEDAVQESLGVDRLVARLSAAFGILGVLLASIGLYGAIAHSVVARTREIGIRIAVGATTRDVIWMVLKQGLVVTSAGILIGLPAAIGGSRLIKPLLFEISPWDPLTLAVSAGVLTGVSLVAGFLPARRAARLDPSRTLRFE